MDNNWKYTIRKNSSVDIISRCVKFYEQAADFQEILDYADADEDNLFQDKLEELQNRAIQIISRESEHKK